MSKRWLLLILVNFTAGALVNLGMTAIGAPFWATLVVAFGVGWVLGEIFRPWVLA